MAIIVQSTDSINAPAALVMSGAGDRFWLLQDVIVVSSTFRGLLMSGVNAVVTIDGTVQSFVDAVQTNAANSSLFVGSTGTVRGSTTGINMLGADSRLVNHGAIEGVVNYGVYSQQMGATVMNSGTITGGSSGVYLHNPNPVHNPVAAVSLLENHGAIIGGLRSLISPNQSSGVVVSHVAQIVNFGTITSVSKFAPPEGIGGEGITVGILQFGLDTGGTSITNHGTVSSASNWGINGFLVRSADSTGIAVVNTGLVSGAKGSLFGSGLDDSLENTGRLSGKVLMNAGADRMVNAGEVRGDVSLGEGNDTLDGRGGTVTGQMLGDAGNDVMTGGSAADDISGGADLDTLRGGDGNDSLSGDAGDDSLSGGAGNDSISGGAGLEWVEGGAGEDTVIGDFGQDLVFGGSDADLLFGDFDADTLYGGNGDDEVIGGTGADLLFGDRGDDAMNGGTEDDVLYGEAGNDTLYGDDGADSLMGAVGRDGLYAGQGRDTLTGGQDADVFLFLSAAEAGLGTTRDRITDFATGLDRIDLSLIRAGQVFIGDAAFSNLRGEIQYIQATGLLSGDTNGDGVANYSLQLAAGTVLVAGDLVL